jgi:ATP-dependent RNA helicase RhlE
VTVLIATDLASRGIDVDDISHVINFDLPIEVDNYVHRIGRTARAGASGIAISFCSGEERSRLKAIERLIRLRLEVRSDLPKFVAEAAPQRSRNGGSNGTPSNDNRSRRPLDNRQDFGDGLDDTVELIADDVTIAPRRDAGVVAQDSRPQRRPFSSNRPNKPFRNQEGSAGSFPRHGNGPKGPRRFGKSGGGSGKPPRPFAGSTR